MAAVNAMKRRQMALWGPRDNKPKEEKVPLTPQERRQDDIAINDAFVDVFSNIIKESPRTLADSRYYPKNPKTQGVSKADKHAHATNDDGFIEYDHYHDEVKCEHNAHSVDERYRHTGVYEHDFHISTATDKKELSPHSKKLRDEAFQRVCSGFTEGEPFARPPSMRRQPSDPTPSNKTTVTSSTSLIPASNDPKLENITPMTVSPNPKPFSDPTKLNQKSDEDFENRKSTEVSPPKGKQPPNTPVQAESAKLGINKSHASSTASSIKQSEAVGADGEYIPPHLRALKGNLKSSSASHGVLKPALPIAILHSSTELAPSDTASHEAALSGLPKLAPFNIPSREASLPNSTKPASSNTIVVSSKTLSPHLRSVEQQDIGVKPDPIPASLAASRTTSMSSKTLPPHLRTIKQEDVGINPGNISASSNFANTTTLPPHLREIKDQDVGVKSSPISSSFNSSSSSNARRPEDSRKPLDAMPAKPVIPAPASKAAVSTPAGKPDTKKPADTAPVKEENLEHAPFFGAWPKLTERDAAGTFLNHHHNITYCANANFGILYSFTSTQDHHYQTSSRFEAELRCLSCVWWAS